MGEAAVVGGRLRALRDAVGAARSDLADALGISDDELRSIESGQTQAGLSTLADAADYLEVSLLSILEPDSLPGRLPIAPRVGDGNPSMGPARALLAGLAELHEALQEEGHEARPLLDEVPDDPYLPARDLAKWAASRLGENLETSPTDDRILTLAALIESRLGIDVMIEPLGESDVLGVSITDSEFPFILVNSDVRRQRALFTLAHELGHVLVGDGSGMQIDFDKDRSTGEERYANAFAAALLMPQDEIEPFESEHQEASTRIARMLIRFGVSYETLIFRLNNLELMDDEEKKSLLEMGRHGFVGGLEDSEYKSKLRAIPPQLGQRPPMLLAARCLKAIRDGVASPAPLADLLGIERSILVERLRRCESDEEPATVERLLHSHPAESDPAESAEFVDF